jgi:hypothetical protein
MTLRVHLALLAVVLTLLGGCAIYPGCSACPKHTDPAMAPLNR